MDISRENRDDLNAVITIRLGKADYEGKVETVLKDYRKKGKYQGIQTRYGADRTDQENVRHRCKGG